MRRVVEDNILEFMEVMPGEISDALGRINGSSKLVEVILDVGRYPTARYWNAEKFLLSRPVTQGDIDAVVSKLRPFDTDNRTGIDGTLHRISAIRSKDGTIIGLTCRIGRVVYGAAEPILDCVKHGQNVLLLGSPGSGKTTTLRELSRVLAEHKRVVIVDTSNEIGGEGIVPHNGVGKARRLQVPKVDQQYAVMIEAVENHTPEVVVIDEIGRDKEVMAARTTAERGVQLIATAHGTNLGNLIRNPVFTYLAGGVNPVILSDEVAQKRGTQKTVLERKMNPVFDVLIEVIGPKEFVVYPSLADAVDDVLLGKDPECEIRKVDGGDITMLTVETSVGDISVKIVGIGEHTVLDVIIGNDLPVQISEDLEDTDALFISDQQIPEQELLLSQAKEMGIPVYRFDADKTEISKDIYELLREFPTESLLV